MPSYCLFGVIQVSASPDIHIQLETASFTPNSHLGKSVCGVPRCLRVCERATKGLSEEIQAKNTGYMTLFRVERMSGLANTWMTAHEQYFIGSEEEVTFDFNCIRFGCNTVYT